METDHTFNINIVIANKSFQVSVKNEKEEEVYRAAAKRINEMVSTFQQRYGVSSENLLDCLYLTAFQHTVQLIYQEQRNDADAVLNEVKKISQLLDVCVK